jgi:Ran-binding protein 3
MVDPLEATKAASESESYQKEAEPTPPIAANDGNEAASADDNHSRKRDREGSLEPSLFTPTKEPFPAKKNRLQDSVEEEEESTEPHGETERVGQIRKKVNEMSTKETKAKDDVLAQPEAGDDSSKQEVVAKETSSSDNVKREKTPPVEKKTAAKLLPNQPGAPVRTQPTFSSFSSRSSPFSAVPSSSGSSAGPPRVGFASFSDPKSSSSDTQEPATSGVKPSSLGSSVQTSHEERRPGESGPAAPQKASVKGPLLGFGAFAGASPLSKPKQAIEAEAKEKTQLKLSESKDTFEQKSLGDQSASPDPQVRKPLLETDCKCIVSMIDIDAHSDTLSLRFPILYIAKTGEEDEESIHSIRAKLYTMSVDQNWKERGTGTLRVNVPRKNAMKRSARIGEQCVLLPISFT